MAPNILGIAELRIMVIQFLRDDENALLSAMLVNKTWAAEAIGVKWETVEAGYLAWISPSRRQQYARHVKKLRFESSTSKSAHVSIKGLEYPRLKSLDFYPNDVENLSIAPYLKPSLRTLVYYIPYPREDVFHLLKTRCLQLQRIEFWCNRKYDPEEMISFLQHCTSLKSVHFSCRRANPLDNKVLSCLARYNGLEDLRLSQTLSPDNVDKMLKVTGTPLRDLKSFEIRTESTAVPKLMENMKVIPNLRCLSIDIEGMGTSNLPCVGLLSNLRRFTISAR